MYVSMFLRNCVSVTYHLTEALMPKILNACGFLNDHHCKQMQLELDISFSDFGFEPRPTTTFKVKGHQSAYFSE